MIYKNAINKSLIFIYLLNHPLGDITYDTPFSLQKGLSFLITFITLIFKSIAKIQVVGCMCSN